MILYSAAHLINLSNQLGLDEEPNNSNYDSELVGLWSNDKCNWKYFYSRTEEEEAEERNILIKFLRDKFTIAKRENRRTRYGSTPFSYISKYHKQMFLEIVSSLGLVKSEPPKYRTVEITAQRYDMEYVSNKYQEDYVF
jgi:hypothetical protein